jgi:O-antigen/teichoic acid export membrane protein
MGQVGDAVATSARGGLITFLGGTFAAMIGALGTLLVAGLLSPSDYGLYTLSLLPEFLFVILSDWGVSSAVTRYIARYRSNKTPWKTRRLVRVALLFKLGSSSLLSFALFVSASWVATVLLNRPQLTRYVQFTAMSILFHTLYVTSLAIFAGYERMGRRAIVNVAQSVIKAILSPILIILGFGVTGAILGHVVSFMIGGSLAALLAIKTSNIQAPSVIQKNIGYQEVLTMMTRFGIPIFIGNVIGNVINQFRGVLLPWFISDELIGNYDVAFKFGMLTGVLAEAIRVTLYPAYSKFTHTLDPASTRMIYRESVRYVALLILPWTLLLASLAQPLIYTLFGAKYPNAPQYLVLLLLPSLLASIGYLCNGNFLNSQGETRSTFKIELVRFGISISLTPVLLYLIGIDGFILANLCAHAIATLVGLYIIQNKFQVRPDFWKNIRIFITAVAAAIGIYGAQYVTSSFLSPLITVIVGMLGYLLIFLVLAPFIGAIDSDDINTFKSLLRDLKWLQPVILVILRFETKILSIARSLRGST